MTRRYFKDGYVYTTTGSPPTTTAFAVGEFGPSNNLPAMLNVMRGSGNYSNSPQGFQVNYFPTTTEDDHGGIYTTVDWTPDANSARRLRGLEANLSIVSGNIRNYGDMVGLLTHVYDKGSGTDNTGIYGAHLVVGPYETSGAKANVYGVAIDYGSFGGSNTSTLTNAYGLFIAQLHKEGSAAITNNYGLYIQAQTGATNNYNIYIQNGGNGVNSFGDGVSTFGNDVNLSTRGVWTWSGTTMRLTATAANKMGLGSRGTVDQLLLDSGSAVLASSNLFLSDGFDLVWNPSTGLVRITGSSAGLTMDFKVNGTRMTLSSGLIIGAPTGGDKGGGTLNVQSGYYANGTAGITGTLTTASLVGKTLTFTNGLITGFA